MHPKLKSLLDVVVAEKWWFLGPILALAILMVGLLLLGGGAGGQGFSYF